MRRKSILFGIVLILLAVYLVVSRLGYAPAMPFIKAAFSAVLVYTMVRGFIRLQFTEGFLSLAILGCIHDELLRIEKLTPWTLLLAGLLLGTAFDMIFKGARAKRKHICGHGVSNEWDSEVEDIVDGQTIRVVNSFGSKSKYVNSEAFTSAQIENSFGECNVYFNNAILAGGHTRIVAENNFGETNIYLPRTWRISVREETAFGVVNVRGKGSMETDAPLAELVLTSNFGELNVFFE